MKGKLSYVSYKKNETPGHPAHRRRHRPDGFRRGVHLRSVQPDHRRLFRSGHYHPPAHQKTGARRRPAVRHQPDPERAVPAAGCEAQRLPLPAAHRLRHRHAVILAVRPSGHPHRRRRPAAVSPLRRPHHGRRHRPCLRSPGHHRRH